MSVSFESLFVKWETAPLTFSTLTYNDLYQKRILDQCLIYEILEKWLREINVVIFDLSNHNLSALKGKITSVNSRPSTFLQFDKAKSSDLLRFGVMLAAFTLSKDQDPISSEHVALASSAKQLAASMLWFESGLNEKKPIEEIVARTEQLEQSYLNFAEQLTLI
jgi:hypothetical protein